VPLAGTVTDGGCAVTAPAIDPGISLGPTVCDDVICPPKQCCHETVFGFECRGC
jgi:hypothetical protein